MRSSRYYSAMSKTCQLADSGYEFIRLWVKRKIY